MGNSIIVRRITVKIGNRSKLYVLTVLLSGMRKKNYSNLYSIIIVISPNYLFLLK